MHEQADLVELCMIDYTARIVFVDRDENGPIKVTPLRKFCLESRLVKLA